MPCHDEPTVKAKAGATLMIYAITTQPSSVSTASIQQWEKPMGSIVAGGALGGRQREQRAICT